MRILLDKREDGQYVVYDLQNLKKEVIQGSELTEDIEGVQGDELTLYGSVSEYLESQRTVAEMFGVNRMPCRLRTVQDEYCVVSPSGDVLTITDFVQQSVNANNGVFRFPEYINYACLFKLGVVSGMRVFDGRGVVGTLSEEAFSRNEDIREVHTFDMLNTCKYLFSGCVHLQKVIMPLADESWQEPLGVTIVPAVSDYAFSHCDALHTVELDDRFVRFETHCFDDCEGLHNMTMPKSLKSIGDYCFSGSGLVEFRAPNGLEYIEQDAFMGCDELQYVSLNEGLKKLGDKCFSNCEKLTYIEIPESVQYVGDLFVGPVRTHVSVKRDSYAYAYLRQWNIRHPSLRYKLIVR